MSTFPSSRTRLGLLISLLGASLPWSNDAHARAAGESPVPHESASISQEAAIRNALGLATVSAASVQRPMGITASRSTGRTSLVIREKPVADPAWDAAALGLARGPVAVAVGAPQDQREARQMIDATIHVERMRSIFGFDPAPVHRAVSIARTAVADRRHSREATGSIGAARVDNGPAASGREAVRPIALEPSETDSVDDFAPVNGPADTDAVVVLAAAPSEERKPEPRRPERETPASILTDFTSHAGRRGSRWERSTSLVLQSDAEAHRGSALQPVTLADPLAVTPAAAAPTGDEVVDPLLALLQVLPDPLDAPDDVVAVATAATAATAHTEGTASTAASQVTAATPTVAATATTAATAAADSSAGTAAIAAFSMTAETRSAETPNTESHRVETGIAVFESMTAELQRPSIVRTTAVGTGPGLVGGSGPIADQDVERPAFATLSRVFAASALRGESFEPAPSIEPLLPRIAATATRPAAVVPHLTLQTGPAAIVARWPSNAVAMREWPLAVDFGRLASRAPEPVRPSIVVDIFDSGLDLPLAALDTIIPDTGAGTTTRPLPIAAGAIPGEAPAGSNLFENLIVAAMKRREFDSAQGDGALPPTPQATAPSNDVRPTPDSAGQSIRPLEPASGTALQTDSPPLPRANPLQGTLVAVADSHLAEMRGGFETGSGLAISFGIERAVYINGNLVTTTSLNINDLTRMSAGQLQSSGLDRATLGLVQSGPNNSFGANPIGASSVATVIQNSLDNQRIQGITQINATVNSMDIVRRSTIQHSIQSALTDSIRR